MSSEVEDIFEKLGSFGRYQKLVFTAACLFAFVGSPSVVQDPFTTYEMDFRCYVPSCDDGTTEYNDTFIDYTIPRNDEGNYETCDRFSSISNKTDSCLEEDFNPASTQNCSQWIYDEDSLFKSTLISDFDLVCSDAWLVPVCGSCYMAGALIGAFVFGVISDKYGRKNALMISLIIFILVGIGSAWVQNYTTYLVLRVITGSAGAPLFPLAFVLAVEFIGSDRRTFAGTIIQIPFALGETFCGIMAIFIRDWRWLQTSIIAPSIALIPLYWLMPESVRWLISKGRYKEAKEIIKRAAKVNKVEFPPESLNKIHISSEEVKNEENNIENNKVEERKLNIMDIMRYPKTRIRTFIMFYCWMVCALTYYGLSSNTGNLSGNIFVNFILTMLIEIPSYIFAYWILDVFGRKGSMMLFFIAGGISCIISGCLPEDLTTTIVTLSLIGKFGVSAAFGSIYIYSAELFPTGIRSLSIGLCSVCSRIGGILAPIISELADIYKPLPLLIFGVLALVAGILYLFLPETYGTDLPQTMEESENFGDPSIWYFLCFNKKKRRSSSASSKVSSSQ